MPTDTATEHALLLTDVVDSTHLLETLGDEAMGRWWALHDRLARDLLPAWRGREIDKTDGMLLLFDSVPDAAGYALAYHRALKAQGLPFAARAGLHSGRVTLRANAPEDVARGAKPVEVIGLALPLAARVMSVAAGGQTLLSADAARALPETPCRLRSQGHWRLQGVAEPLELFALEEEGCAYQVPHDGAKAHRVVQQGGHWLPVAELRHSLPAERDSFVGRSADLHALADKLARGVRLVTVSGMGGAGKTRLATHAAWSLLGLYPGGAWFCDLSAARTLEGIHFAVAQGLDLPLGRTDAMLQIAQALSGRCRCLVVLDNFEQVARHAEATVGQWLDRAPQAQFVVTTRELLGIAGEQVLSLPPLNPDDASALFAQRAAAARLGYVPGEEDIAAIRQLVRVLDGLPLAIELAAARVRVMPPRTLVARMRDRFDALFSRSARHDRQTTLRAAFDWSWELLSDAEKQALATLSVFEGGFTLETADAVITAVGCGDAAADFMVPWLVDKSLVRQVADERFDLLETVREYAASRLRGEGSFPGSGPALAQRVQAAHWRHFAALDERGATADRCAEANNLVAACRAATAAGDTEAATGCLRAAWAALRLTGPYRVASELAGVLAERPDLRDAQRAEVHWMAADALELLGETEPALASLRAGLEAAVRAGADDIRVRLLLVRGRRANLDGELDAALQDLAEAYRLAAEIDDPQLLMLTLNELGAHMDRQSRWAEARDCYERALAISRRVGDRRLEGGLLGNLGGLYHDRGELEAARSHIEQALDLAATVGDRRWAGNAHCNLGLVLQEQGHRGAAREQFSRALAIAREIGHVRLAYTVECNLGILAAAEQRLDDADRHLRQAVESAQAAGDRRAEGQFRGYLALNLARRGHGEAARASLAIGDQLLHNVADRLSQALLLCDRAEVESLAACPAAAAKALAAAQCIAIELDCTESSELGRRLAALGAPLPRQAVSC
ncbi:ATP-binding protein [Aquabacterium humicola]|uniref:ATP-binding protein n=1 Tax=Aquabacterium humicola TaxID=3237377 RepID=UPI0025436E62|nr:tetratricopeptide repeat protein [Rubrivivax pictus]